MTCHLSDLIAAQVIEKAKSEDRWLLVNIQRDSEFQCHLLNRCAPHMCR